jgi:hypothetical protein
MFKISGTGGLRTVHARHQHGPHQTGCFSVSDAGLQAKISHMDSFPVPACELKIPVSSLSHGEVEILSCTQQFIHAGPLQDSCLIAFIWMELD